MKLLKPLITFSFFAFVLFLSQNSAAGYLSEKTPPPNRVGSFGGGNYPGYLSAQSEGDDTYDPFSDYSEFDESSDEEADINFFKHGRFFTVGFAAGVRSFTESLGNLYTSAPTYGLFLSYFFDLRLALQFGFNTGDYAFELNTNNEKMSGNVSLTFLHMNLKYYMNTQNVTRGLADLNPYFLGGFSQVYRTYTITGQEGYGREAVMGVDLGLGIEIPLMRRKAFFGIQATYHMINFKDENTNFTLPSGTVTSAKPKGDTYDLLGIIGMNF